MTKTNPDHRRCPACKKVGPMMYGMMLAFWRCDHWPHPKGEECYEYTTSCVECGTVVERSKWTCAEPKPSLGQVIKGKLLFWRKRG